MIKTSFTRTDPFKSFEEWQGLKAFVCIHEGDVGLY